MRTHALASLALLQPGAYVNDAGGKRKLPSATALHLLAYLVLEARPIQRRKLATLFWPDADLPHALHSLSQQLYKIRRCFQREVIISDLDAIAVAPDELTADVLQLIDQNDPRDNHNVVWDLTCDFLADASFTHEELATWCDAWRTRTRVAATAILQTQLDASYRASNWPEVLRITERQLEISPYNEEAAAKRALALTAVGDLSAAIGFSQSFRARFVEVLEREPALPRPGELLTPEPAVNAKEAVPFVGRHTEFARLKAALDRASRCSLQSILVTGAPGAGKTRLANHALRWAAIRGFTSVYIDCSYSERLLPYGTVARLLELKESHQSAVQLGSVVVDNLAALFERWTSQRPLAVCLDNIQWMDASSADVLGILADRLRHNSVFLLLVARSGDLRAKESASWGWVGDDIQLSGLSARDVAAIIRHFEEQDGISIQEHQRRWFIEDLGGSPFFVIETLKHILSNGGSSETRPVPPRIQRVIKAQIATLSSEAKRLLSCTAVFGTQASTSEVCRASRLPAWRLIGAIDELTSAGLVAFNNDQITIRHDLIRDVIYGRTPPHVRQMLHATAAQILGDSGAARATERVRHQYFAQEYSKAFTTALAAAEAANKVAAFVEAECFLRLALRTANSPAHRALSTQAYLDFLCDQRRFVEALRPGRVLLAKGSRSLEVRLAVLLGKCAVDLQRGSRSISEIVARAEDVAEAARKGRLLNRMRDAVLILGELVQHEGRVARAQYWADQFLAIADGDIEYAVEISGMAATLAAMAGDTRSYELSRRAVAQAEASGKPRLIALARTYKASAQMMMGSVDGANADYLLAKEYAERAGMRDALFFSEGNRAVALIERGCFDEARAILERCLKYGRRGHAFQHANLAILGIEAGDLQLATGSATVLLTMYASYRVPWITVAAHSCLGIAALASGDIGRAATSVAIVESQLQSAGSALSDHSYPELLLARFRTKNGDIEPSLRGLASAECRLRNIQPLAALRLRLEACAIESATGSVPRRRVEEIVHEADQRGASLIASRARVMLER